MSGWWGLLRLRLTLRLWDLVLPQGCRCAQEVPARVRARRRPGRRGGLSQVDVDDGIVDGQTSAEQYELVQLRREKRRLEMNEVLRRAAAYFAHSSFPG